MDSFGFAGESAVDPFEVVSFARTWPFDQIDSAFVEPFGPVGPAEESVLEVGSFEKTWPFDPVLEMVSSLMHSEIAAVAFDLVKFAFVVDSYLLTFEVEAVACHYLAPFAEFAVAVVMIVELLAVQPHRKH